MNVSDTKKKKKIHSSHNTLNWNNMTVVCFWHSACSLYKWSMQFSALRVSGINLRSVFEKDGHLESDSL